MYVPEAEKPERPAFEILDGDCSVYEDCIHTPAYPLPYDNNQTCLIKAREGIMLNAIIFQMEIGCPQCSCDAVNVNGVDYCDEGPDGVIVLDPYITFRTDHDGTRKGFRICWDPPEGEPLAQMREDGGLGGHLWGNSFSTRGGSLSSQGDFTRRVIESAGVTAGLVLLLGSLVMIGAQGRARVRLGR